MWKVIEIRGYEYYANKGYRILISLVTNSGYDFVAEKDNKYIKVNVKMAGLKSRKDPNSWSISKSGGKSNCIGKINKDVDIYLVWLPHKNKFIELPANFLHITTSKSKIIPKNLM